MNKIEKIILSAAVLLFAGLSARAQSDTRYSAKNVVLTHEEEVMQVAMDLDLSVLEPDRDATVMLIPVLSHGEDAVRLRPVGIYSRGRFYRLARSLRTSTPLQPGDLQFSEKDRPDILAYTDSVPYEEWMDGATLRIDTEVTGCCDRALESSSGPVLARYEEPEPAPIPFVANYVYVRPDANVEVKERSISGEAYVVFQAGKSEVVPKYQNNEAELAKIRATIDSVRVDEDIVITMIALRGYSSPDGKYAKNDELSRKRTESIRGYVSGLYNLPGDIYRTESVAENWEGLRAAVEASDKLKNREKILEIIDADLDPDKKEARIKAFAKDYNYLSKEIFPLLRRTDYRISYTVRTYTTTDEIRQIMQTRPQNLSINEFFLLSQDYRPGTREFNEVFAVMARVYPDDETANINAANAAMSIGDYTHAARYLALAGDSATARYTKGVYEALQGRYEMAVKYFTSAEMSGVREATGALALVRSILERQEFIQAKRARQK